MTGSYEMLFIYINMKTFTKWMEETKAWIGTRIKGSTTQADGRDQYSEPSVMLNIDEIGNYEPTGKMRLPASRENMQGIINAIRNNQPLPPILVRRVDNLRGVSNPRYDDFGRVVDKGGMPNSRFKYLVVDGHHRYWAYKKAGIRQIPAVIISPNNVVFNKTGEAPT